MKKVKAIVVPQYGAPDELVIQDCELKSVGAGEALDRALPDSCVPQSLDDKFY